jgi:protein SCO1/2
MTRNRPWRVTAALGLAALLAACGSTPDPEALRGTVLAEAWPRPDFSLTDTGGEPFAFRARTAGTVTLLFFGYTHCPDVCPVHLGNIAAVLGTLTPDVSGRVRVVFVSTDPERDTADRIRSWLDGFDRRFIGLRGSLDEVNAIQQRIGLAAAVVPDTSDGDYTVGHGAQVIAYTADDSAHVVYGFGTRQADWAADLPRLVGGEWD